ncbi:MGMT family protein [Nocardioides jensenii]|uniref:MGMT family protein n=1 Tax=Nocardioides jensenii TaxID=1843 RepID=UPI000829C871|nr:MGMT family protein [Nocardioides jensenii]
MGLIDDVREEVCAIPPGQVWSYGDIGEVLHISARQVGRVMGILDDDDAVPWWRVVRADGTPATCHEGTAPELLAQEGTPMRGSRVDMRLARRQPRQ